MSKTSNLKFKMLHQNQAQKEVTVNESLVKIDAILGAGIISKSEKKPPKNPKDGQSYIVPANVSKESDWPEEKIANIAYFFNLDWHYIKPKEGHISWINDISELHVFSKGKWIKATSNQDYIDFNADGDLQIEKQILRDFQAEESGDSRVYVSKSESHNFASHIFKRGSTYFAEFGLLGNDHFGLKVSPNGVDFKKAMEFDNVSASCYFEEKAIFKNHVIGIHKSEKINSLKSHDHIDIDGKKANIFEINMQNTASLSFLKYSSKELKDQKITLIIQHNNHKLSILSKLNNDFTMSKKIEIKEFITTDGGQSWYVN